MSDAGIERTSEGLEVAPLDARELPFWAAELVELWHLAASTGELP